MRVERVVWRSQRGEPLLTRGGAPPEGLALATPASDGYQAPRRSRT